MIHNNISEISRNIDFSGSILISGDAFQYDGSFGYANRAEELKNNSSTRFGIASGSKLFTAIATCQLAEKGLLSFNTRIKDFFGDELPHIDENITIHHLLTHTSGIPDYFDEEVMDDFEELWVQNPMYTFRELKHFLPLFKNLPMKHSVGERFHYNNAGYIVLGLLVEKISNYNFTDYVQTFILNKANMTDSGFFSFDSLPMNTAYGYIDHKDGSWKTNIYSLPVKGGSDGGIYVTSKDMEKLWRALLSFDLLNKDTTEKLLKPHIQVNDNSFYGYGVWIRKDHDDVVKYHVMGYDPGVSFHSGYYPNTSSFVTVCSNKSDGAFDILKGIEEELLK